MPRLHATPYDISYAGFFFATADEFERQMQSAPYEEVEIQFTDGTEKEFEIFKCFKVHQGNVREYLHLVVNCAYSQPELAAMSFLIRWHGYRWHQASDALEDVEVYEMNLRDLAFHFAEEGIFPGECPTNILPYLDYDLLARELEMDYTEFHFLGQTYCARSP